MKYRTALIIALLALPGVARADSLYVESWRDRAIDGALSSAKPAQSLRRCIASGLGAAAHSEDLNPRLIEIDTPARTFGVRIVDQGSQRVLIFVADPHMTERGMAVLKSCV